MEEIRFDDIEKLKGKISDAFGGWSEPVEVTQEMINGFAELTGDHEFLVPDSIGAVHRLFIDAEEVRFQGRGEMGV